MTEPIQGEIVAPETAPPTKAAAPAPTAKISGTLPGGLQLTTVQEVTALAQLMAKGGVAVRDCFRGDPGACAAIVVKALEWEMSPYSLASVAYVVGDNMGFEAKLFAALVNRRGGLSKRLRYKFEGSYQAQSERTTRGGGKQKQPEGDRRCTCIGWFEGEDEPFEYTTPPISDITPKNSTLWAADPDRQLVYYATRAWARMYCAEVILGVFTPDELQDHEPEMRNITPGPVTGSLQETLAAPEPESEPVQQSPAEPDQDLSSAARRRTEVASYDGLVQAAWDQFYGALDKSDSQTDVGQAMVELKATEGWMHMDQDEQDQARAVADTRRKEIADAVAKAEARAAATLDKAEKKAPTKKDS